MRDNGSFISFPALGCENTFVILYANSADEVERSYRQLNSLTYDIHEAVISFSAKELKISNGYVFSLIEELGNFDSFTDTLREITMSSNAAIKYSSTANQISIVGDQDQVKSAYRLMSAMSFFKKYHRTTSFSLHLAIDQRDFICGKKNGKMNKITKQCGVKIRFSDSNNYNLRIIIDSTNHDHALTALNLMLEEVPAELSFYIPETHHRRIIGTAGKSIQKIMRKYGVYVKFTGDEDFLTLGGYFENFDNVIARTPSKNSENLSLLRAAVVDLVPAPKDRDLIFTTVTIPYIQHRTFNSDNCALVRELLREHNAKVLWPERLGLEEVQIFSPRAEVTKILAKFKEINGRSTLHILAIHSKFKIKKTVLDTLKQKLGSLPSVKSVFTNRFGGNSDSARLINITYEYEEKENAVLIVLLCQPNSKLEPSKVSSIIKKINETRKHKLLLMEPKDSQTTPSQMCRIIIQIRYR
ncbi:hypothetical protein BDB01DRAFT_753305 [Pilobolus umbonatus]|nr:hypothetical protein BDB01DRAFT_753305 [Pilobolus umbonatus]